MCVYTNVCVDINLLKMLFINNSDVTAYSLNW